MHSLKLLTIISTLAAMPGAGVLAVDTERSSRIHSRVRSSLHDASKARGRESGPYRPVLKNKGDTQEYCKKREKVKATPERNPWLWCGCVNKKEKPYLDETSSARCLQKETNADPKLSRPDLCSFSETGNTANPDGVKVFCAPNEAQIAAFNALLESGALLETSGPPPNGETPVAGPSQAATLDPGCDAAKQNRIELTCGQFSSKSSDACKEAYSKCLPAIAEAVTEGLPYAGCTKSACGPLRMIMGARTLDWSVKGAEPEKFCCPKRQDEPTGCESHTPIFPGWPHCCVKNEGSDKCSSFYYNNHPKLEYTHSVSAGGHPVHERYCCPDDPAIGARLQREADEKAAVAAELERMAKEAEQKAKDKAEKEEADRNAAIAKKAAEEKTKAERAAAKAEKERKRAEESAKREQARQEAVMQRDREKREKIDEENKKAEEKQAATNEFNAAKEIATAAEAADDAQFLAQGCVDYSVYKLLFGRRKPAEERKDCPANLPVPQVGIECLGHALDDKIPGRHWCCKHADWKQQCIADCKGAGHTEPGNPCFVKCRVDVLYTKVPDASDPDPPSKAESA